MATFDAVSSVVVSNVCNRCGGEITITTKAELSNGVLYVTQYVEPCKTCQQSAAYAGYQEAFEDGQEGEG